MTKSASWVLRMSPTWRKACMWLWLWAKLTSLLAKRVIYPTFPARGVCLPAAATVGCKITQHFSWKRDYDCLYDNLNVKYYELHPIMLLPLKNVFIQK